MMDGRVLHCAAVCLSLSTYLSIYLSILFTYIRIYIYMYIYMYTYRYMCIYLSTWFMMEGRALHCAAVCLSSASNRSATPGRPAPPPVSTICGTETKKRALKVPCSY